MRETLQKTLRGYIRLSNKKAKIPLSSSSSYLIIDLNKEKTVDFIGSAKDVWEKLKSCKKNR